MNQLPVGKILDVGAGESPWKEWLPNRSIYHGIDLKNAGDFGMTNKGQGVTYFDGNNIPYPDNHFEGAICIEVLEHVKEPKLLLKEVNRVLKKDAILLITVPWSARRHHIPFDYHRYTKEYLAILLAESNYKNIEIEERGNDIASIANKVLIVFLRQLKQLSFANAIYKIPLAMIFGILSIKFLILAHLSLLFRGSSNEDPLGYFCKASKQ